MEINSLTNIRPWTVRTDRANESTFFSFWIVKWLKQKQKLKIKMMTCSYFFYRIIVWVLLASNRREVYPGVNFINLLRAPFLYQSVYTQLLSSYSLALYFYGSKTLAQKLLIKCWWTWLQLASGEDGKRRHKIYSEVLGHQTCCLTIPKFVAVSQFCHVSWGLFYQRFTPNFYVCRFQKLKKLTAWLYSLRFRDLRA